MNHIKVLGSTVLTLPGAKRQWYHRDSKAIANKTLIDVVSGKEIKNDNTIPDLSFYFPLTDRWLLIYDRRQDKHYKLLVKVGEFLITKGT